MQVNFSIYRFLVAFSPPTLREVGGGVKKLASEKSICELPLRRVGVRPWEVTDMFTVRRLSQIRC